MFIVNDLDIIISRGDTATLDLTFSGDIPSHQGDLVVMALKSTPRDKTARWEKVAAGGETVSFRIEPEDTKNLPFGTYYWDARIFYQNGNVATPFPPKKFVISEVVTNDREPSNDNG